MTPDDKVKQVLREMQSIAERCRTWPCKADVPAWLSRVEQLADSVLREIEGKREEVWTARQSLAGNWTVWADTTNVVVGGVSETTAKRIARLPSLERIEQAARAVKGLRIELDADRVSVYVENRDKDCARIVERCGPVAFHAFWAMQDALDALRRALDEAGKP